LQVGVELGNSFFHSVIHGSAVAAALVTG